ncbi:hypothetical protein QJS66_18505 [Kocuria rhizophila]|nr:hypothetical protein QJS66_18505 [Kocuria rhizophila]
MLNEQFDDPRPARHYERFAEEMVDLVLGRGGSLKAEHRHGARGAVRAAAVRGRAALRDGGAQGPDRPREPLQPRRRASREPRAYLRDLKTAPPVESEVDRCVSAATVRAGVPVPRTSRSRRASASWAAGDLPAEDAGTPPWPTPAAPRVRLRRAASVRGGRHVRHGVPCAHQTRVTWCAGCARDRSTVADLAWGAAARSWAATSAGASFALHPGFPHARGTSGLRNPRGPRRARRGHGTPLQRHAPRRVRRRPLPVEQRRRALPCRAERPEGLGTPGASAVGTVGGDQTATAVTPRRRPPRKHHPVPGHVLPACIGAMFGTVTGGPWPPRAFLRLCERAGVAVRIPEGIDSACCRRPGGSPRACPPVTPR